MNEWNIALKVVILMTAIPVAFYIGIGLLIFVIAFITSLIRWIKDKLKKL